MLLLFVSFLFFFQGGTDEVGEVRGDSEVGPLQNVSGTFTSMIIVVLGVIILVDQNSSINQRMRVSKSRY